MDHVMVKLPPAVIPVKRVLVIWTAWAVAKAAAAKRTVEKRILIIVRVFGSNCGCETRISLLLLARSHEGRRDFGRERWVFIYLREAIDS